MNSKLASLLREVRLARGRRIRIILSILDDKLRRLIGPLIANQNVIYIWDRAKGSAVDQFDADQQFEVRRCAALDDIPVDFWSYFRSAQPDTSQEEFLKPFLQRSILWIGVFNGRPVSHAWSVRRRDLGKEWYLTLRPDDIIVFAVVTWSGFRGRGFARILLHRLVAKESAGGNDVYLDTKHWNIMAQRSFEKAGFRRVAIRPQLPA